MINKEGAGSGVLDHLAKTLANIFRSVHANENDLAAIGEVGKTWGDFRAGLTERGRLPNRAVPDDDVQARANEMAGHWRAHRA
jgi:hypothetical protein